MPLNTPLGVCATIKFNFVRITLFKVEWFQRKPQLCFERLWGWSTDGGWLLSECLKTLLVTRMHCLLAWTLQETHHGSPVQNHNHNHNQEEAVSGSSQAKGILMSTIVCSYKVETFPASFDLGGSPMFKEDVFESDPEMDKIIRLWVRKAS